MDEVIRNDGQVVAHSEERTLLEWGLGTPDDFDGAIRLKTRFLDNRRSRATRQRRGGNGQ